MFSPTLSVGKYLVLTDVLPRINIECQGKECAIHADIALHITADKNFHHHPTFSQMKSIIFPTVTLSLNVLSNSSSVMLVLKSRSKSMQISTQSK